MVLNLRRTLERDSKKPKHIHTVRGVGLRFTAEAES
jgi:DNA-binding response OmpR family regulator